MVIGFKDSVRFLGISVVCICAVFVCTFMLNYYLDVVNLGATVAPEQKALYEAQLSTAQFCVAITGGALSLIAAAMLAFYIRLYVTSHAVELGVLKAIGYSRMRIARGFWVFGLSVFCGCALGFGVGWAGMPVVYKGLTIEGMDIPITFHPELMLFFVVLPTLFYSVLACGCAYFALKISPLELLRGKSRAEKKGREDKENDRPFLWDMCCKVLKSKKSLMFFVAFAAFCFGAMVQMGLSMEDLVSGTMGLMILCIGLVLAVVILFMAVTALIRANGKNIAVMKAFGYPLWQCALCILGGYVPFAFLGFFVGTAYQYGLLQFMVNVIFANVGEVPEYHFNVPVFWITLSVFVVCYACAMAYYTYQIGKVTVKEIMLGE